MSQDRRRKTRVLIVDDSALAREIIAGILADDPDIEIVGAAENGQVAVELVAHLRPHLVTMDMMMPVMDGLAAIQEIMAFHPTPILVVTSSSEAGLAYRAVSAGALEVMQKPEISAGPDEWAGLIRRVKLLAQVRVITHLRGRGPAPLSPSAAGLPSATMAPPAMAAAPPASGQEPILAIGASTGGPAALASLLAGLPAHLPAGVVVVQHIAEGFVTGLIGWLRSVTPLRVKAAEDGERIECGSVYVAPTGTHTSVLSSGRLALLHTPPVDNQRPAVDVLFEAVGNYYGRRAVAVLLTGMGRDGARGLKTIREAGGRTIAQDEATSVVYGMPRAAVELQAAEQVLALDDIAPAVLGLLGARPESGRSG